ncbi:MAG: bacteriohemerythrin [Formivibrio sp.]|nr:bacteriohemerythrin [Formivibrio sp.]
MAYFNWTNDLSVGNTQIDSDHKQLVDLVNKLHDAMKSGKGNTVLGEILADLIQYTSSHFKREEMLMQKINYAEFAEHKAEHTKLVGEVLELQTRFKTGATTLSVSVFNFLSDWLRTHIKSRDVKLAVAIAAIK